MLNSSSKCYTKYMSVFQLSLALCSINTKIFPVLESAEITQHLSSLHAYSSLIHTLHPHPPCNFTIPGSIKCIHTGIKASPEKMYSENKSNKFIIKGFFFPPTSHFHCDLSVFPKPSPFLYCGKNRLSSLVYILQQASFSSWRFLQLSGDTCLLC